VSYSTKQPSPEGATWLIRDGVTVGTFWQPGGDELAATVTSLLNSIGEREWLRGMLMDANQNTIANLRAAFEAAAGSATPTEPDLRAQVELLHQRTWENGSEFCDEDGHAWPCRTIRLLSAVARSATPTGDDE
jgi:hypothetical protein